MDCATLRCNVSIEMITICDIDQSALDDKYERLFLTELKSTRAKQAQDGVERTRSFGVLVVALEYPCQA